jgi:hydroxymethylbilane synthase
MHGVVAEPDGSRLIKNSVTGSSSDPVAIGVALAEKLLAAGAEGLLAKLRTA